MIKWHLAGGRVGHNGFGEFDPYIDWAFGDARDKFPRKGAGWRFPLLLKLREPFTIAQFAAGEIFAEANRPRDWKCHVFVPEVYRLNALGERTYFTAFVTEAFFREFFHNPGQADDPRHAIARMAMSERVAMRPPGPVAEDAPAAPSGEPEHGTVVVGIIDAGLAFANARFRTEQGGHPRTRIEYIWLQDGRSREGQSNAAGSRYGYGLSYCKDHIDGFLCKSTHAGLVDEDEVYVRAGAIDFARSGASGSPPGQLTLRASHGAHVMDLVCGPLPKEKAEPVATAAAKVDAPRAGRSLWSFWSGRRPRQGAPESPSASAKGEDDRRREDDRPIVCVQLPEAVVEDTSGASLDTYAVDGVRYILEKADAIAQKRGCGPLPVVINLSYGTIAGRHDGKSSLECALEELIEKRKAPLRVVIPAGNSRLARCHARVSFESKGQTKCLSWQVLPDDRTPSHLEVWLPEGPRPGPSGPGRVTLSVKPPGGEASSPALGEDLSSVLVWGEGPEDGPGGVVKGRCYVRYSRGPEAMDRGMFLVTVQPTVLVDAPDDELKLAAAPAGVWRIMLQNGSLEPSEKVYVWVQRDDAPFRRPPFGRQSYLDDPEYVRWGPDGKVPELDSEKSLVKRAGTLNAIATEPATIVIGGFRRRDSLPADYSGEGPALSTRKGPDASAVCDDSIVHTGILAAGTRSGSVVAMSGTSVAAPQVTRLVADMLARGEPADPDAIRRFAGEHKPAGASNAQRPREERIGGGRIERSQMVPVSRYFPSDEERRNATSPVPANPRER